MLLFPSRFFWFLAANWRCVELVCVRSLVDRCRVELRPLPYIPADRMVDGMLWLELLRSNIDPLAMLSLAVCFCCYFSRSWFMFIKRCSVETQKYDITVSSTISVKLSLEMVYRLHLWMHSSGMSSRDSYWLKRFVSNSCGCRFDPCDELES